MLDLESQLFEKIMFLLASDLVDHLYTRCKRHDDDSHDVNLCCQVVSCIMLFLTTCKKKIRSSKSDHRSGLVRSGLTS